MLAAVFLGISNGRLPASNHLRIMMAVFALASLILAVAYKVTWMIISIKYILSVLIAHRLDPLIVEANRLLMFLWCSFHLVYILYNG